MSYRRKNQIQEKHFTICRFFHIVLLHFKYVILRKKRMFIVFEGIDGSGTTTQIERLCSALRERNIAVVQTAEPSNGFLGKLIRKKILSGKEYISRKSIQLLFFADRQDHLDQKIVPAIMKGDIVVSDRYKLSTIVYSALDGHGAFFAKIAAEFPNPDLTIFLDIAPEKGLARVKKRGKEKEIFEKLDAQKIIAKAYKRYIAKIPKEKKLIVDAEKSIDDIAEIILTRVLTEKGL